MNHTQRFYEFANKEIPLLEMRSMVRQIPAKEYLTYVKEKGSSEVLGSENTKIAALLYVNSIKQRDLSGIEIASYFLNRVAFDDFFGTLEDLYQF